MRRLRAYIISSLGGIVPTAILFLGLPGHVKDVETWHRWLNKLSVSQTIFLFLVAGSAGPLMVISSSFWWPWLRRIIYRLLGVDKRLLKQMWPKMEECRKQSHAYLKFLDVKLQWHVRRRNEALNEALRDLADVERQLRELGIKCPSFPKDGTVNIGVLSGYFYLWGKYLDTMCEVAKQGDIDKARQIRSEDW